MIIELHGLELFGYHGVLEEEKQNGQTFWYDIELEVGGWGSTDRLEQAVDYRLVVDAVREVNERRFEVPGGPAGARGGTPLGRVATPRGKGGGPERPPGPAPGDNPRPAAPPRSPAR